MSYADFDDIYRICCDWSKTLILADEVFRGKLGDEISEKTVQQANRWWEIAEEEIKKERETVLI